MLSLKILHRQVKGQNLHMYLLFTDSLLNTHVYIISLSLPLLITSSCRPCCLLISHYWHMQNFLFALFTYDIERYVNGVKPGRYGVPRPFYFPLLPSYWTGRSYQTCHFKVHVGVYVHAVLCNSVIIHVYTISTHILFPHTINPFFPSSALILSRGDKLGLNFRGGKISFIHYLRFLHMHVLYIRCYLLNIYLISFITVYCYVEACSDLT